MHELISQTNPQWHEILDKAIDKLDLAYRQALHNRQDWLPGSNAIFAAFHQPVSAVKYVLLGESPYPRAVSANGYAFWDAAVDGLWSDKGLSKTVNRATSLRNWIKMMLVARGDLTDNYSQSAIAALDKSIYWQTADELFQSMIQKGFLLLNASLVYREGLVNEDTKQWSPFLRVVLHELRLQQPDIQLILLGRMALQQAVETSPNLRTDSRILRDSSFDQGTIRDLIAEHPYNLSFITNPNVLQFFKPLDLLKKDY